MFILCSEHLLFQSGTSVEELPRIQLTSNKTRVPQHKWICKQPHRKLLNSSQRLTWKKKHKKALLWRLIYLHQMLIRCSGFIQIFTPTILDARYHRTMSFALLTSYCGSKFYLCSSVYCFFLLTSWPLRSTRSWHFGGIEVIWIQSSSQNKCGADPHQP